MRKKFTRAGSALGLVSLVVRDYDEALAFFIGTLGFELVEDTPVPEQHLIQPNSGNRSWPPRPK